MEKIIGHGRQLGELQRDLESRSLAHAYLLAGPRGVGKMSLAAWLAEQILLPESPDPEHARRQIAAKSFEYFTIVDRLYRDGIDDDLESLAHSSNFNQSHRASHKAKTDTLGIADLAEILLPLHRSRAGHHVVLIRRLERLTPDAANFFLKTLEEPPPGTIFLLTTDSIGQILPTLISRCRVLRLGTVADELIAEELKKQFPNLAEADLQRINALALGRPGAALRLAADPEILRQTGELFARIKAVFAKPDTAARLRLAEEAAETRDSAEQFLDIFTHFLRSFLLQRARRPDPASRFGTAKLAELIHAADSARDEISHNVTPRLVLESLLLRV